ncbi:MAG: lectin like domain-containing protein [Armatimonadota bacterium]
MVRYAQSCRTLLVVILVLVSLSWACAQTLGEAPVNADFQHVSRSVDVENYGYQPSPVNWSYLRSAFTTREVLPLSYNLNFQGKVTPVRSQGSSGSCWAFATYGSLESCLLPDEQTDFSENHLKNASGFDWNPNTGGGNRDMSTAYLARWDGPIAETDDPFVSSSLTSLTDLPVRKHIEHVIYLPNRLNALDNTAIKKALMSYGAVYTLMYWNGNYYNDSTAAFYIPSTPYINHAVTIVGWDDDYNASNFKYPPPGNGAFLIKNSWGSTWGNQGFFYISYYDAVVGKQSTVYHNAEETTKYTRCYQYDPLGMTSSVGYGTTTCWQANIFTAAAREKVAAVSTYALMPNTGYEISVYLRPTNGPLAGSPITKQTGTFPEAGYHTVTLQSPVTVSTGDTFSVVMKITTPGFNFPVSVERPFANYSSKASALAGQSYVSSNGTSWTDLSTQYLNTNVCLKAFTIPAPVAVSTLTAVNLSASPSSPQFAGKPITLTATKTGGVTVCYQFDAGLDRAWTTIRGASTTANTTWIPTAAGTYSVKVSAYDVDAPEPTVTKTLSYVVVAPLSSVSLAATLTSPQPVGKTISLSATKMGGLTVQYQFSASKDNGTTWSALTAWGTATAMNWTPSATGTYLLRVAAREGSTGLPVISTALPYQVAPKPPTAVSLTCSPVSPQSAGKPITLKATKTGGTVVEYRFEVSTDQGVSWTALRDFSTVASVIWTPAVPALYSIRVSARESTYPAMVVTKVAPFTIAAPLTAVSLTPSLPSPQPVGKTISQSAKKTGGMTVQYQFSASKDNGTTWSALTAWGTSSTVNWTPSTAATYLLRTAAREGSTGLPVLSPALPYQVVPKPPTAVSLTCSPVSPQSAGKSITLKATKTGGTVVEYRFEVSANQGVSWTALRDFSTVASVIWTPAVPALYSIRVSARESTYPAVVVTKVAPYTVVAPLTAVSLITSLSSPQPIGKTIGLSAMKTGGMSVQYQFSVSKDNCTTWSALTAWGTASKKNWTPSTAGTYLLRVAARQGSTGLPVVSAALPYQMVIVKRWITRR